jgi:hypothetical protein
MVKWILIGVLLLAVVFCLSTRYSTEQFVDGKDMYPTVPELKNGPTPVLTECWNGTRARDGRCPEFLWP